MVFYQDALNNYGYGIVGTVSGTSISFGSANAFTTSLQSAAHLSATYDEASGKVVIFYRASTGNGRCKVATVSGTSISFGSEVVFNSGSTDYIASTYDSNAQKIVIVYRDGGNSNYGTGIVGTVSGTSISFGTEEVFSFTNNDPIEIAYHAGEGRVVVIYKNGGNSNYGTALTGLVSGTSIAFGSPVVFNSASTGSMAIDYDSAAVKMVITYRDQGNSNYGTYVTATVSGENITFSSETVFESAYTDHTWITFDASSNSNLISYRDSGNTDNGTGIVLQNSYNSTNLTAENYIGMSRGVVEQTTVAQAAGTPVTYESAIVRYTSAAYDANSQKVVISYRDQGNLDYGTAVVGTVNASNNSISFGTPVVFESASVKFTSITYDANAQKVVIAYEDEGNSQYGTAIVGTVSGTSISFGTATVFKSSSVAEITSTYDSTNNKVVIAYAVSSAQSQAIVGTVSGTSISFGTATGYESTGFADYNSIAYDANAGKVVIAYRNGGAGNLYGRAVVGTVSGTSISFGSPVTYNTAATEYMSTTYDSVNQKIVIAYQNNNTSYGMGIVGTVSGTSISFGTAATFSATSAQYNVATYDANAQRIVVSFRDGGNSLYGTVVAGQVDGTSISFNTPTVFQTGRAQDMGTAYDSNAQKVVTSFWDYAASTGDAVVLQAGYTSTDRSPVADGNPARVNIIGAVSENQSSLTAGEKYYVQTDGTLSTTAGSPSVLAGTAISATKLVVKT